MDEVDAPQLPRQFCLVLCPQSGQEIHVWLLRLYLWWWNPIEAQMPISLQLLHLTIPQEVAILPDFHLRQIERVEA